MMTTPHPMTSRINWTATFFIACLCGSIGIRLVMRNYDFLNSLSAATLSLSIGLALAWSSLKAWRFTAPVRSAFLAGLCGALAGSGLFPLFSHLVSY